MKKGKGRIALVLIALFLAACINPVISGSNTGGEAKPDIGDDGDLPGGGGGLPGGDGGLPDGGGGETPGGDGGDNGTPTHQWSAWQLIASATCTLEGVETRVCTLDAGHRETRAIPIDPNAHIWIQLEGTAATCTNTGTGERECTHNSAHKEIGVLSIDPNAHNWGAWNETTAATCIAAAEETRTCTHNAAHKETQAHGSPNPLGHEWGSWAPSSFIEAGVETRECTHDSAHKETKTGTGSPQLEIKTTDNWTTAKTQLNGKTTGNYTLTINGSFGVAGSTTNTFGATSVYSSLHVTLKGSGTMSLTSNGSLLSVGYSQTLVIDSASLTFKGLSTNNAPLVLIHSTTLAFPKFELKNGTISGNTGGGVCVGDYGTFTMTGGTISGNTADYGGGVFGNNYGAQITMTGGTISGNTAVSGGGVYSAANFTMNGGTISDNTADYGGGVYSIRTSTMTGGTISGNTAVSGGGVYARDYGTFTMTGGTISGNTASDGGGVYVGNGYSGGATFNMNNGTISGNTAANRGGGVYVYSDVFHTGYYAGTFHIVNGIIYGTNETSLAFRNNATSGAALYNESFSTAQRGTFSGTTWNSNGDLTSPDTNTIEVINGVLQ